MATRAIKSRIIESEIAQILASTIVLRGVSAIAMLYLARRLGAENLGYYGYVVATFALISSIGGLGLQNSANRYLASHQLSAVTVRRLIALALMNVVLAAILIWSIMLIGTKIFANESQAALLQKNAWITLAGAMGAIAQGIAAGGLSGLGQHRTSTAVNGAAGTLPILASLYAATQGDVRDVLAFNVIVGLVVGSCSLCLLHRAAGKLCSFEGGDVPYLKFLQFGVTTQLGSLLIPPVIWAANTVLANSPEGISKVGILTFAMQFRQIMLFIPAALGNWMLAQHSSLAGQSGSNHSSSPAPWKLLTKHIRLQTYCTVIIGIAISVGYFPLVKFAGKSYQTSIWVTLFIVASSGALTISNLFAKFTQAHGDAWAGPKMDLIWSSCLLLTIIVPTAEITAEQVAFGYLLGSVLQLIYANTLVRSKWAK